ncbi:MAG: transglutaminase family protein, partial [Spirochaetaceae bacterium]|nr:transglutaminase family protein [Spirochaetaceae bacterium]
MVILVSAMVVLIGLKFILFGYSMESVIPVETYSVRTSMTFTGNGDDLVVRTFLPQTTDRQSVTNETIIADGLEFNRDSNFEYDRGNWLQYRTEGDYEIDINYRVAIQPVRYEISSDIRLPGSYPESMTPYLEETEDIQVNSPEIVSKTRELVGEEEYLLNILVNLFDYVYGLGSKPFKGTTDALTALRLEEASCNGKSRLFVAMARNLGIPSRLVGGLILNPGTKRTSHQWLEVFINGYWVPFDTLNGHFAKLPKNYLTLYHGDEVLFRHSRNIGFDYHFDIKKSTVSNSRLPGFINDQSGASFNA